MRKPYLSLIIPTYHGHKFIGPLLSSIFASSYKNFEVIVVDDVSNDGIDKIVSKHKKVRFYQNKKRLVGGTRDKGAKYAKADILVFIDQDVVLYKDTLENLVASFRSSSNLAVVGMYDWIPANKPASKFHYFKSMRDYAYLVIDRNSNYPIGGFGGCISAIRRSVYKKVGSFKTYTVFKNKRLYCEMGDMEMGARINRITKIVLNPKVKVRHNFHGFITTFKNFYIRTYYWMTLYHEHKLFVGPAMNPYEAFVAGLANLSLACFVLGFVFPVFWFVFISAYLLRLYFGRKFIQFAVKKKGIGFLPATLFFSQAMYLAVYLGVFKYTLELIKSHWNL